MTSKCPAPQNFCVTRGQTLDIEIPVFDEAGDPVDLSTAVVTFGIALRVNAPYILTLPTVQEGNLIRARLDQDLQPQTHYYSVWVDISDDETPTAFGSIDVRPDPRPLTT